VVWRVIINNDRIRRKQPVTSHANTIVMYDITTDISLRRLGRCLLVGLLVVYFTARFQELDYIASMAVNRDEL
jgi:hypothetical protein